MLQLLGCNIVFSGYRRKSDVKNMLQKVTFAQTSLKWYSTIAVLSGTLAPAGTFLKNNDKICPAD